MYLPKSSFSFSSISSNSQIVRRHFLARRQRVTRARRFWMTPDSTP